MAMTVKDLSNLLEHKLSNWNQDRLPELESLGERALGWSWSCDASGRYSDCSPEVEQALGLPPLAFLKKPLATAHLSRESVQMMHVALAGARLPEDLPLAVGVRFVNARQEAVPATVTIMEDGANADAPGLRGFVQITPEPRLGLIPVTGQAAPAVVVSEQVLHATVAYQENDYLAASQNLLELLERLRYLCPAIIQSTQSRLRSQSFVRYSNKAEAVSHDPERLPLRPPGSAPQVTAYSLEHRLEWGEKLSPSQADKDYLHKNRQASGLLSRLRISRAPERILLQEKSWLHCALHIRPGESGSLILQVDEGEIVVDNAVDLLLSDPEALLPQLFEAINQPRSRTRWAERGKHYLRQPAN
jgi:hypothetical protein